MTRFFGILTLLLNIYSITNVQVSTAQKLDSSISKKTTNPKGIVWYNPKEGLFNIDGFEWIKKDTIFRRLPIHSAWKIPKNVDDLANQTAGGQIRFKTNSKKILLKVQLLERSGMYHMAATGQSGFDIYIKDGGNQKYIKTTSFSHNSLQYQVELYNVLERKTHEFTINFPLYNGVKSVLVGLEKGASISTPKPFKISGKVVIYGTSITQGGCVSRPGMLYSNLLSRKLDVEFINLGFSGNGKGEPELAHIINQITDINLIILDYEANANKTIKTTLNDFVDVLRERHPLIPILIMSKIRYSNEANHNSNYNRLISNRNFQSDLVNKRKSNGDKNIYFLDGSTILGDDYDECTVDGVHPTDLGSYRIAKSLLPLVKSIILPYSNNQHKN